MSDSESSAPKPDAAAHAAARHVGEELEKVVPAPVLRQVRKVVVMVLGGTVLLIGIALMILPGPAFLVIPAGLAILGLEFAWARRWLRKAKAVLKDPKGAMTGRSARPTRPSGRDNSPIDAPDPKPGPRPPPHP